jgi:hypothetical protein
MQRICVIARHVEAAALRGALWAEGADNYVAARSDGMSNLANVSYALVRGGQEVEHGAVVPNVVGATQKLNSSDVASDPLNALSRFFQTFLGHIDCGLRDVEHGNVLIASGKKVIDERGFAAPNIDDGS